LRFDKKLTLLNDIDKLRFYKISQYVNLSQLIVYNDQLSDKSSVLNVISEILFSIKNNLCTRFAIEVILRYISIINIFVIIVSDSERSKEEQKKLLVFRYNFDNLKNFSTLVDDTRSCIDVIYNFSAFFIDVFRLEISESKQSHLTIVDLPNLIYSENKLQTATNIQIVQNIIYKYIINRRSIVLTIVSAKNNYVNQIVLKLTREINFQDRRTIEFITKSNTLSVEFESEFWRIIISVKFFFSRINSFW